MATPPLPCRFDGCTKPARGLGLCVGHYRQDRLGHTLRPLIARDRNKGKPCSGPECDRLAYAKGLCNSHKCQLDRGQPLTPIGAVPPGPKRRYDGVVCSFDECERAAVSADLCGGHYAQSLRGVPLKPIGYREPRPKAPCSVDGCDDPATRKGFCDPHYRQDRRGDQIVPRRRSTGRYVDADSGYAFVKRPGNPEARKGGGWGAEHRVVMADVLGRALFRDETPHHRNGVRDDNRPENLELWSSSQPPGQRVADKLTWAHEIIARYADVPEVAVRPSPAL